MRTRTLVRILSILAVVGLAVAASASGASSRLAAKGGGTLTIGMTASNIPLLDTGLAQNEGYEGLRFVGNQLYDGLTRFDLSSSSKVPQIVPALATSWKPNKSLTVWTFKLRKGVTFHDGTPWNADAAIFNLGRYADRKSKQYYPELNATGGLSVSGIKSFKKLGPMTIRITTKGPWSYLPVDLATVYFGSPKAITKLGNAGFATHPVGTGPFMFKEFVRGQRLVLLKNPHYWRGAPKLDQLVLRPIPDPTARSAALKSGEVNWIEVPLPDDVPVLKEAGFNVLTNSYDHIWPWVFDTSKPPFSKKLVRQALNYAINRESLVENVLNNTAEPAYQAVPRANLAYTAGVKGYSYDPAKAKKLLAKAGYPKGFSFTLSFPTSGSGNMVPVPMNEALQADLAKVGVKVNLRPIEWASMLTNFFAGKIPDGAEALNISLSYQQEGFWSMWFGSGSTLNAGKYSSKAVDRLFAQAKRTLDDKSRYAIYARAAKLITSDAAWLFVVDDKNPRALAPNVKGFVMPKSWFVDLTTTSVG